MTARILIVSGEVVFHRVLIQHFRNKTADTKYEFVSAADSQEFLNKIKTGNQIDLILLHLKMPNTDGFTFLEELDKQNIKVKTIIVSPDGDKAIYRKAMQLGAYDLLETPIDPTELVRTIDRALQADKPTLKTKPSPPQVTGAKGIASNLSEKKPHPNSLLKMVKELPPSQRVKFIFQIIGTINDFEDLEDIGYQVEAQIQIAANNEAEREEVLVENQKREVRGESPLITLENGWVEMRYMTRKLVSGEKRRYGPYYYMRWRENGKLKSKCLGKEDPSALLKNSNIRVYELEANNTHKSSKKEASQVKKTEPRTFRLA